MAVPDFLGVVSGPGSNLTTTTSFVDIGGLSFNVQAGGKYRFGAYLTYQGGTASSSKFDPALGGTCTASFVSCACRIGINNGDGTSNTIHSALLPTSSAGPSAVGQSATSFAVTMHGYVEVQNSGTLTVVARHITASCTVMANLNRFWLEQVA